MSTLTIVAARARNGVMGRAGGLPWRLPSDLKRFKAATMGKPIVMGRSTWQALPKAPLPGRANIVVTRDRSFRAPGAHVYSDLAAALAAARAMASAQSADEVCIIGGAELIAHTLGLANRMVLTEIDLAPAGDVMFPTFDESAWREAERVEVPQGKNDDAAFAVRTLVRR